MADEEPTKLSYRERYARHEALKKSADPQAPFESALPSLLDTSMLLHQAYDNRQRGDGWFTAEIPLTGVAGYAM